MTYLPSASHAVMVDRPDTVAAAIRDVVATPAVGHRPERRLATPVLDAIASLPGRLLRRAEGETPINTASRTPGEAWREQRWRRREPSFVQHPLLRREQNRAPTPLVLDALASLTRAVIASRTNPARDRPCSQPPASPPGGDRRQRPGAHFGDASAVPLRRRGPDRYGGHHRPHQPSIASAPTSLGPVASRRRRAGRPRRSRARPTARS